MVMVTVSVVARLTRLHQLMGQSQSNHTHGFKNEALVPVEIRPIKPRKLLKATCQKYGYGYAGKKHVATYRWNGKQVAQHSRNSRKEFFWNGDVKHLELYGQALVQWFPLGPVEGVHQNILYRWSPGLNVQPIVGP